VSAVHSRRDTVCATALISATAAILIALGCFDQWVQPLPGREADSASFVRGARNLVHGDSVSPLAIGEQAYLRYLSWYARLGGSHWLVLNLSSVLPATAALALVASIAYRSSPRAACILVLGMLVSPGFLLYGALPFREALQLLSLTAFLAAYLADPTPRRLATASPLLIPAMVLHPALFVFGCFIIVGLVISQLTSVPHDGDVKRSAGVAVVLVSVVIVALSVAPLWYGKSLYSVLNSGMTAAILEYRGPIEAKVPATAFDVIYREAHWAPLASFLFRNYLQYLFYPLADFRVDAVHVVLAWEALVRAMGLLALVALVRQPKGRWLVLVLAAYYVSLTFLWSVGTTNGGQALRHHVLTQWVPLLMIALWWTRSNSIDQLRRRPQAHAA